MNKTTFRRDLLSWYDSQKRILPWRDNTDPYRVWISEIMLQQTRVSAVIPYFDRFISSLPTIKSLANVGEDELMKLWEGLGYYSRARNLKKAAIKVMQDYSGMIPNTYDELLSLPGIGPYTAGAILSIAFNKPYTAVDGNVLRVFARIKNIQTDIKDPATKSTIKETISSLLPKRVGDFNQALMEIGATVCLPNGQPKCDECPIKTYCIANKENTMALIPLKKRKKPVPILKKTVLILRYNEMVAIEKRPNKGLLASMYQFPMVEGHISKNEIHELFQSTAVQVTPLPKSTHVFSHKKWNMIGYEVELSNPLTYHFVSIEDLLSIYSIPTAFKQYKNGLRDNFNIS